MLWRATRRLKRERGVTDRGGDVNPDRATRRHCNDPEPRANYSWRDMLRHVALFSDQLVRGEKKHMTKHFRPNVCSPIRVRVRGGIERAGCQGSASELATSRCAMSSPALAIASLSGLSALSIGRYAPASPPMMTPARRSPQSGMAER